MQTNYERYGGKEIGNNCPLARRLGTVFVNMDLIPFENEHQVICVDHLEVVEPSFSEMKQFNFVNKDVAGIQRCVAENNRYGVLESLGELDDVNFLIPDGM